MKDKDKTVPIQYCPVGYAHGYIKTPLLDNLNSIACPYRPVESSSKFSNPNPKKKKVDPPK